VSKLRLWQDFTSATQDVDMFYRAVAEFQSESSRLLNVPHSAAASLVPSALGRHRSKITRTASTAADAVLRALNCGSPPGGDAEGSRNPADGFKDLWAQNDSASTAFILSTARTLVESIRALSEGVNGSEEEINAAGWVKIDAAITALWDLANEVYPLGRPGAGEAMAEHPVRAAVAALAALELPQMRGQGAQEDDADVMQEGTSDHSGKTPFTLFCLFIGLYRRLHLCTYFFSSSVCSSVGRGPVGGDGALAVPPAPRRRARRQAACWRTAVPAAHYVHPGNDFPVIFYGTWRRHCRPWNDVRPSLGPCYITDAESILMLKISTYISCCRCA
jgi:hypothetical protein